MYYEYPGLTVGIHNTKKEGLRVEPTEIIDLFFILSTLISSELDVNKMDYLIMEANILVLHLGILI